MSSARAGHRTAVASVMTAVVLSLFALTALPNSNGLYYGPSTRGAIEWSGVGDFSQRVRLALHRTSDQNTASDTVPMVGRATPSTVRVQQLSTTRHLAELFSAMLFALFGLFVLWWGRDAVSLWLGTFCASFASPLLHPYGALPEWAMLVAWTLVSALAVLAIYAFYALAETVALAAVHRRRVLHALTVVRVTVLVLLAVALAGDLGRTYLPVLWRTEFAPQAISFVQSWFLATFTIALITAPLALLGAAVVYARDDRHRLNSAVIFATTTVALWGVIYSIVTSLVQGRTAGFDIWWFSLLAIPLGFIVTISTMKIVDVKVVISKILALAALSITVGAVIIGAELLLRNYIEKRWPGLSIAAQFVIALGILYWASALYHRLTDRIRRFVFRRQYAAVDALRELAHKAPFFESRSVLLEDAAARIADVLGAKSVAMYEDGASGYRLIPTARSTKAPKQIDRDDEAAITMRARVARVDLAIVAPRPSLLGRDGFAFPMAISGKLSGMLVVGSRTDEAEGDYLPEELDALDDVAQKVGDALFRMRANEIAAFVGMLADGRFTDGEVADRARALRDKGLV